MAAQHNPSRRVLRRRKLLWRYGFPWTFVEAFKLARRLKASGADIWPPLEDEYDIERDFDPTLADSEMNSEERGSDEMTRAVDVLEWGILFLEHNAQVDLPMNKLPTVHTGVTGTIRRQTDVLLMGSTRVRRLTDINIEDLRNAGKIADDETLAALSEYLGELRWFPDWKSLKRKGLLDFMESGEYQPRAGITVPPTNSAASV